MKNEKLFFDLISPIYVLADSYFSSSLKEAASRLNQVLPLKSKTLLDVGTGTGSWAIELHHYGAQVSGIDFSSGMLAKAKKRCPSEILIFEGNALSLNFPDKSFDWVTSSLVLHGPGKEQRKQMLKEMMRVSRQGVIIHDYYKKAPALVHLAEAFERSDYYYFRENFEKELLESFSKVQVLPGSKGLALYIAENS